MTLSADVRLGVNDGRLAGKSVEQVYRIHNGFDENTGEPVPGCKPPEVGFGCQCDHCREYVIRSQFR